jgi:hypothetical protein
MALKQLIDVVGDILGGEQVLSAVVLTVVVAQDLIESCSEALIHAALCKENTSVRDIYSEEELQASARAYRRNAEA